MSIKSYFVPAPRTCSPRWSRIRRLIDRSDEMAADWWGSHTAHRRMGNRQQAARCLAFYHQARGRSAHLWDLLAAESDAMA